MNDPLKDPDFLDGRQPKAFREMQKQIRDAKYNNSELPECTELTQAQDGKVGRTLREQRPEFYQQLIEESENA